MARGKADSLLYGELPPVNRLASPLLAAGGESHADRLLEKLTLSDLVEGTAAGKRVHEELAQMGKFQMSKPAGTGIQESAGTRRLFSGLSHLVTRERLEEDFVIDEPASADEFTAVGAHIENVLRVLTEVGVAPKEIFSKLDPVWAAYTVECESDSMLRMRARVIRRSERLDLNSSELELVRSFRHVPPEERSRLLVNAIGGWAFERTRSQLLGLFGRGDLTPFIVGELAADKQNMRRNNKNVYEECLSNMQGSLNELEEDALRVSRTSWTDFLLESIPGANRSDVIGALMSPVPEAVIDYSQEIEQAAKRAAEEGT